jgi:hypothetical protein
MTTRAVTIRGVMIGMTRCAGPLDRFLARIRVAIGTGEARVALVRE